MTGSLLDRHVSTVHLGWPPARIAEAVDAAADLIDRDGLERGDLWANGLVFSYEPGVSCCTGGALAVACGYTSARKVESEFFGLGRYNTLTSAYDSDDPHPVLVAVLRGCGFDELERLFEWSDNADAAEVVARLRGVAALIRIQAAS